MKRILLSFLVLVSAFMQAREIRSIRDLRPNDTISIRITVPAKNAQLHSVWDFEQGNKIDVNLSILSIDNDSLRILIKPTRLLVWFPAPENKQTSAFFDSDYISYYDNKQWFYLFDDNSVTTTVNIANGGASIHYKDYSDKINYSAEERTGRVREEWYVQALNIPRGIKFDDSHFSPVTDSGIDFTQKNSSRLSSGSIRKKPLVS